MATKYIYLDDAPSSEVAEHIAAITDHDSILAIESRHPKAFQNQIKELRANSFDGLILDLRLSELVDPTLKESDQADYKATSLAQEWRTEATERPSKDCPIVLWSTDEKLRRSFNKDRTGHDLFDLICVKDDFMNDRQEAKTIAQKLVSLANGYETLRTNKRSKLCKHLGFEREPTFLDPRVLNYFDGAESVPPVHEIARFILRQLLESPGPLIDEHLLAARLGIDFHQSPDFGKLKTRLTEYAYRGVFSEGWQRWWSSQIEHWWKDQRDNPGSLRQLKAEERVQFLKKSTKLKRLKAAAPIKNNYSQSYWVVCQVSGQPLDPRDGFLIQQRDIYPWQDRLYVSTDACLSGEYRDKGLTIDPLESERLKSLRSKGK